MSYKLTLSKIELIQHAKLNVITLLSGLIRTLLKLPPTGGTIHSEDVSVKQIFLYVETKCLITLEQVKHSSNSMAWYAGVLS